MTSPSPRSAHVPEAEHQRGERLQALCMLLPAAVLAWPGPGSFLRHDWTSAATGAAVALLATFPALLVLLLRGHARAGRGWFLLLPLLASGFVLVEPFDAVPGLGDAFERERATFLVLAATSMLVCGASLSTAGRRLLARGLALLSIAFTLVAHFDGANAHAGALGNTGSVSQAALAGAVVSAGLLFEGFGPWSLVHAAAIVLQFAYVGRVPVIAGALAAVVGCAALALLCKERAPRLGALALGVLAVLVAVVPRLASSSKGEEPASKSSAITAPARAGDTATPARAGDTGGIAVRQRVWWSTLALVADHPFLGVGLGQFAARFPAYRDPEEIELSSHRRRIAQETEVEHAHCDYLTLLAEGGLVFAAGAFVLFALVLRSAVRALRSDDVTKAALAAAALALLANGLVHGALLFDPVSSALAFGVFGVLLGPVPSEKPVLVRRLVPWFLLAASAVAAPSALAVVRQARILAPIERGEELTTEGTGDVIERALDEVPHAPLALSLEARWLELRGAEPERVRAAWNAVLARRPQRVEALMQSGIAYVRSGIESEARRQWETARSVDPRHPGVLWNLMTLAFDEERASEGLALTDELEHARRLDADRLFALATRLETEGKDASAQALWTRLAPEIAAAGSDKSFQLAKDRRAAGDDALARALEVRAQRGYAREHASHGAWSDALRSYRQMLRAAGADPAPRRLRVEYLAALAQSGKVEEASTELATLDGWESELPRLPPWAAKALVGEAWAPR
ncbi:MAG: O-antigen ligase family protein [Planctomycetes bacterium]|nr:O-antigen ligase family protein [Planctomycetota bacterium]